MEKNNAGITLRTLSLRFSLPLRPDQIPQWRGAVAESAHWENDLFHNHAPAEVGPDAEPVAAGADGSTVQQLVAATLKDRVIYRYPLIHYRVTDRRAAIFAINEGADALRAWLLRNPGEIEIGGRTFPLLIDGMQERRHELRMLPDMKGYRLLDYLPLNDDNYRRWMGLHSLVERIQLLENILTGHLLGFATAMGWKLPARLEVRLLSLRDVRPVRVHGVEHMAFGLVFQTNIDLPDGLALGKAISHGFGSLKATRQP